MERREEKGTIEKERKGREKPCLFSHSFNDYRTDYEETDLLCGQKMLKGERREGILEGDRIEDELMEEETISSRR